jgi:hypothetical protein
MLCLALVLSSFTIAACHPIPTGKPWSGQDNIIPVNTVAGEKKTSGMPMGAVPHNGRTREKTAAGGKTDISAAAFIGDSFKQLAAAIGNGIEGIFQLAERSVQDGKLLIEDIFNISPGNDTARQPAGKGHWNNNKESIQ